MGMNRWFVGNASTSFEGRPACLTMSPPAFFSMLIQWSSPTAWSTTASQSGHTLHTYTPKGLSYASGNAHAEGSQGRIMNSKELGSKPG